MYAKTIICLANSRKPPSGRCVAGKEFENGVVGQWVRPVSSRPGREVSEEERRYESGKRVQLLDIIHVPLEQHEPLVHQTENHVLADDYYWSKLGTASWAQVHSLVDPYDKNFWLDAESSYHGSNDKVSEDELPGISNSLKLVALSKLKLEVRHEAGYQGRPGRKRVRASFNYRQKTYILSVTDPEMEELYLAKGEGEYWIDDVVICVSLAEPWNGYAFRVVASIITAQRCGG